MSKEKILLVDKQDAVVGEKWRQDLINDDCWRIVSIWIIDKEGRILLQKRKSDKKLMPGVWTAAAEGTVDYKDGYDITAEREIAEELGIKSMSLRKTAKYYGPWGGFGKRQCQGYVGVFTGDKAFLQPQESEVAEIKWVSKEELEVFHTAHPKLFPLYEIYKNLGFIS